MAFANEVRDFIDAFQAGAKIKDAYKRRKLDEQEAKDRVSIAEAKNKLETEKFGKIYDQNERKLKATTRLKESELGLKEQAAADLRGYRKGALDIQNRRVTAAEKA